MSRSLIVPVGGFLGAGKTTLIGAAARMLTASGKRCAAILNDQGGHLVDTELTRAGGLLADQVTGGCFCCKLSTLLEAADRLLRDEPDVIFAEAVGSCTDLAATVVRPLMRNYSDRFDVAPLTVLVDPAMAERALAPDADPNVAFLFRKQIEEADLLCYTKADERSLFPDAPGRRVSARTGEGVREWLDQVCSHTVPPGAKLLDIDYGQYAEAEAALGWLNAQAVADLDTALSPPMVVGPLLDSLDSALTSAGARISHLKLFDRSESGWLKAGICSNGEEPVVDGDLQASPAARHELLINLRALADPGDIERVVREQLARLPGTIVVESLECFRPSPPSPEMRL